MPSTVSFAAKIEDFFDVVVVAVSNWLLKRMYNVAVKKILLVLSNLIFFLMQKKKKNQIAAILS